MDDAQLTELWSQILRTARPGTRVLFRTAAEPSLLPGRVVAAAAAEACASTPAAMLAASAAPASAESVV